MVLYKVYDTEKILKYSLKKHVFMIFLMIIFGSCNNTIFRKRRYDIFR